MPEFDYSAVGTGGRAGTIRSDSGSFNHAVVVPGSRRPGVTPEELIAGAWTACFGTTLLHVARSHGIDTSNAVCRATVTLNADNEHDEYTISNAVLSVFVPGVEPGALEPVLSETHSKCPVSKLMASGSSSLTVAPSEAPLAPPPDP